MHNQEKFMPQKFVRNTLSIEFKLTCHDNRW